MNRSMAREELSNLYTLAELAAITLKELLLGTETRPKTRVLTE